MRRSRAGASIRPVRLAAASLLLSGLLLASRAHAQPRVDQVWDPAAPCETPISAGAILAQTFTADATGILRQIDVFAFREPDTETSLDVELFSVGSDGLPDQDSLLLRVTLEATELPFEDASTAIDVSSHEIGIVGDTTYALVARGSAESVRWCRVDGYPRGEALVLEDGVDWRALPGDFRFRTWIEPLELTAPRFLRGDADASGSINLTDAVFLLNALFRGGPPPPCADAADADDDGTLSLTDGVVILQHLFRGGALPGSNVCEPDASADELNCAFSSRCTANLSLSELTVETATSQIAHPILVTVRFQSGAPLDDVAITFHLISTENAAEVEDREQHVVGESVGPASEGENLREVELRAPPESVFDGAYNLVAHIDPHDAIRESDEDDNLLATELVVVSLSGEFARTPNLVLETFDLDPGVLRLRRDQVRTFFGEDLNRSGTNDPLLETPRSDAAHAAFLANLRAPAIDDFETTESAFGPLHLRRESGDLIEATIRAVEAGISDRPSWFGGYALSGTRFFSGHAAEFNFAEPVIAVGFRATDTGDAEGLEGVLSRLQVQLRHVDGSTTTHDVPNSTYFTALGLPTTASAISFGIIAAQPFDRMTLSNHLVEAPPDLPVGYREWIGIDDLVVDTGLASIPFIAPGDLRNDANSLRLDATLAIACTGGIAGTEPLRVPLSVGLEFPALGLAADEIPIWSHDETYDPFRHVAFGVDTFASADGEADPVDDSRFQDRLWVEISPGERRVVHATLRLPPGLEVSAASILRQFPALDPSVRVTARIDPENEILEHPADDEDNALSVELRAETEEPPACAFDGSYQKSFHNDSFGAAVDFSAGAEITGRGAEAGLDGEVSVIIFGRRVTVVSFEAHALRDPEFEYSSFELDLSFHGESVQAPRLLLPLRIDSCDLDDAPLGVHTINEAESGEFRYSETPGGRAVERSWSKDLLAKCRVFFPGGVPVTVGGGVSGAVGFRLEAQLANEMFLRGGPFVSLDANVFAALGVQDCLGDSDADARLVGATAALTIVDNFFGPEARCVVAHRAREGALPERIEGSTSFGLVNIISALDGRVFVWARYYGCRVCWKWRTIPYPCRCGWKRKEIDLVNWSGFEERWPTIESFSSCETWRARDPDAFDICTQAR